MSPLITSLLNGDEVRSGSVILAPVGIYDGLSAVLAQFISLIPFLLGRQVLRSTDNNAEIFRILVFAGLAYSLPMLFEIRMSPQLHDWIYGYSPSDFLQEIRNGGFRPVVFLGHGLAVAFFTMTTVVASAALWRLRAQVVRFPAAATTAYLGIMLVLCKSMGAFLYGCFLVPLVRWAKPLLQLRIAVILVAIPLIYPLLRTADLVPTTEIVETIRSIDAERAGSLETRFVQERQLLTRGSERPFFGWGRYGRSRIYNVWGQDISLTDGYWIITLGQFGLFGFIATFGLLAFPVLAAASAFRYTSSFPDRILLAALALVVGINVFDLLPNAWLTSWTWLIAGALLGRAETLRAMVRAAKAGSSFGKLGSGASPTSLAGSY